MKYIKFIFALCCMACLEPVAARGESEKTEEVVFIEDLGANAIQTLTDKNISDTERVIRFEKILENAFALPQIARFVLGKYMRRATTKEKEDFLIYFKKNLVQIYFGRFKSYANEKFKVLHSKPIGDGGHRVHSHILRPGRDHVSVVWKIYKDKYGNYKITDVIVENVSLTLAQRDEFASALQKNDGSVTALNDLLRNMHEDFEKQLKEEADQRVKKTKK